MKEQKESLDQRSSEVTPTCSCNSQTSYPGAYHDPWCATLVVRTNGLKGQLPPTEGGKDNE